MNGIGPSAGEHQAVANLSGKLGAPPGLVNEGVRLGKRGRRYAAPRFGRALGGRCWRVHITYDYIGLLDEIRCVDLGGILRSRRHDS